MQPTEHHFVSEEYSKKRAYASVLVYIEDIWINEFARMKSEKLISSFFLCAAGGGACVVGRVWRLLLFLGGRFMTYFGQV